MANHDQRLTIGILQKRKIIFVFSGGWDKMLIRRGIEFIMIFQQLVPHEATAVEGLVYCFLLFGGRINSHLDGGKADHHLLLKLRGAFFGITQC